MGCDNYKHFSFNKLNWNKYRLSWKSQADITVLSRHSNLCYVAKLLRHTSSPDVVGYRRIVYVVTPDTAWPELLSLTQDRVR